MICISLGLIDNILSFWRHRTNCFYFQELGENKNVLLQSILSYKIQLSYESELDSYGCGQTSNRRS